MSRFEAHRGESVHASGDAGSWPGRTLLVGLERYAGTGNADAVIAQRLGAFR
jgi:hypothetical protein